MTNVPTVTVIYEPEHMMAAEVDRDTASLEFAGIQKGIPLWRLSYMEPDGNGVECYDVVGDITDVDRAVRAAEDHLRRVWGA